LDQITDKGALAIAARSASTSYKEVLSAPDLADILRSGIAPERYFPHLMALLDEVPLTLVERAIHEAATASIPTSLIRQHLNRWAQQWRVHRMVWQ
jgi:hypothetical protein